MLLIGPVTRRATKAVAVFFLLLAVPAQAAWWEVETAHFVVKSRASEAEARKYALEMEQFDAALRAFNGLGADKEPVSRANKPTIYRFGRPDDMARIYGAPGSGVAGFFISRAGQSVAFAPTREGRDTSAKTSFAVRQDPRTGLDPRAVLFHEYTHFFMMQHFPSAYPRWYVEGFAEMMATMRVNEDGSLHVGDPPQYRAYQVFQLNDFRMREMLDPDHKLTGLDGLQHYATGWLLAHYLSFDSERLPQLRAYLNALAKGENGLEAATREFGNLGDLERALQRYKKGPFPGLRLEASTYDTRVAMRQLSAIEEDAIMHEMRIARSIRNKSEARNIARDLEGKLARHAGNTHLLQLLANAQLAAEDFAAADSTATRLLEIDDENVEGWLVRAMAALERAEKEPAQIDAARQFAAHAAAANRADPRPLMFYYYSYAKLKQDPPERAIIALEQAYDYAGSDATYRLLLARQLVVENKLDSALSVLLPVAFRGHGATEPKDEADPTLPRVVKLVQDQNRDGALAMIDRMIAEEDDEDA